MSAGWARIWRREETVEEERDMFDVFYCSFYEAFRVTHSEICQGMAFQTDFVNMKSQTEYTY
tara:strand:+ start:269 stop:454 length:186 start_codon:yes stop_codon:yes gene_type:complete